MYIDVHNEVVYLYLYMSLPCFAIMFLRSWILPNYIITCTLNLRCRIHVAMNSIHYSYDT